VPEPAGQSCGNFRSLVPEIASLKSTPYARSKTVDHHVENETYP